MKFRTMADDHLHRTAENSRHEVPYTIKPKQIAN